MEFFLDPTPVRAVDLTESEMSGSSGGAIIPIAVTAVIRCGASFGAVVYAVVDIGIPD